MRAAVVACLMAVLMLVTGPAANAQEKGQVGITMGYPASVGVVWQVTDRVAVRPEISISSNSTTTTSPLRVAVLGLDQITTESSNTAFATGISALFYLWKHEGLSTYVTPRYAYSRFTTSEGATTEFLPIVGDTSAPSHSFSGALGAHYAFGRRFAVFGEVGITHTRSHFELTSIVGVPEFGSPLTTARQVSDFRGIATRSGAGVVLYFR